MEARDLGRHVQPVKQIAAKLKKSQSEPVKKGHECLFSAQALRIKVRYHFKYLIFILGTCYGSMPFLGSLCTKAAHNEDHIAM